MIWRFVSILLLMAVAGCEDPVSDMGAQPKYQTYQPAETARFANGASARELPPGAVPRPADRVPGVPYAAAQTASPALADEVMPPDARNPLTISRATLEAGQQQFEVFCAVCHGRLANGEGMIVERGFTRPPSFHIDRLRQAPDGHLYNVITRGLGAMMSYNDRVPPTARWEIVAYIRALQAAGANASAETRRVLVARGDRPTTAPIRRPVTRP